MRNLFRRTKGSESGEGLAGSIRIDERTKNLTKRLQPGEIAVINHVDLDRVAAEALVGCQPLAVLNAAPSTSGRYPNLGPEILMEAGIALLDDLGSDIMQLREGQSVAIRGNQVYQGKKLVAEGQRQSAESIAQAMAEARQGLSVQIEAFTANTMEYLKRERSLLLDGVGVPEVATKFSGRQALIVVRGYNYKEDLQSLKPYIREYRPVLVGVDGGADALLEQGFTPDMIVGDMDSVSDKALTCGAEIVVHAYTDGRAPGAGRVAELGVEYLTFPAAATSEDIAMLLADEKGAELIVALGTHATLIEFLDKGRAGMASTFLTRLRVGSKLVDAKGVSRLYRARISNRQLGILVLSGLIAVAAAVGATPAGQAAVGILGAHFDSLWAFLRELVGMAPAAPTS